MEIQTFFHQLWQCYAELTPQAAPIHALFAADNPLLQNDHVAFRTLGLQPITLLALETHLLRLGYHRHAAHDFPEKKLHAWSYVHFRRGEPRIFLSELQVGALSPPNQALLTALCGHVAPERLAEPDIFWAGRLWPMPSWAAYQQLQAESEYAAWFSVMGLRPNHFTISINSLRTPNTLAAAVDRVRAAGFAFNTEGGVIKGAPHLGLEQASTMADPVELIFADGDAHQVPGCYFELAQRYPQANGELYPGFITASADRIFESTHVREARS